jgi:hypothetical protein
VEVERYHTAPLSPRSLPTSKAGPGTRLGSCRGSKTLITTLAVPEIIATNKHDVTTVVYSKSNRIATEVYI